MTIDGKISDNINREPVKMPALSSSKTDHSRLRKQAKIPFATTFVKQVCKRKLNHLAKLLKYL